jgi:heme-degrading monooxygenase HmoA
MFAKTPEPPYYAVIFTSQLSGNDPEGYEAAAHRMIELASCQPGLLGVESARGADGLGITVSYWDSEASIARWRADAEHAVAREQGRTIWYAALTTRVAKVERAYGLP